VGHLGVGGRQRWPVPSSSLPLPACLGLDWIAPASGNCARIRYVAPICFEFVAVSSDGLRLHGLRLPWPPPAWPPLAVAAPITHLVSVEVIKGLVPTVRMWTFVAVVWIETVINVGRGSRGALEPRADSHEHGRR